VTDPTAAASRASPAQPGPTPPPLTATDRQGPPAPIRIVHLGLGAFHRAHQAWYTAHAPDHAEWGIAAFTGRSPDIAATLAAQGGLYTLVERGPDGDRDEIVDSIVEADDGADIPRLLELFRREALAIVTLTVTEAGYRLRADGSPDLDDPALATDLELLRAGLTAALPLAELRPATTLGRLLLALEARRRSGGGPLAVVPCDNLPGNGPLLAHGTTAAARLVSARLADWMDEHLRFVSTSVDRITPRTTAADIQTLDARAARHDGAPVFTEPFADWVLSGEFPAGRPAWDAVGARFVLDIEPWELRKLRLLNGAHTLLSFAGPPRGHETVFAAFADRDLRQAVERFWDEAARHLPPGLDLADYRAALATRFANPRIEHRLAQIAQDGTRKLRLRVVPVAEAELAADRSAAGCARAIADWADHVGTSGRIDLRSRIGELSRVLAGDDRFVALVDALRHR
jgi:fructuronate reductase